MLVKNRKYLCKKKTYSLNIELRTTTTYTCKTANIKICIQGVRNLSAF
jgi:hypothetical protein